MRPGEVAFEHRRVTMPPKPRIWRLASVVLRMARQARDRCTRATSGCALQPARRSPARWRSGAPCAAPASSGRAAPGSCRTGRRWRRRRSAGSASCSAELARSSPTTATPPTMSEWPFRYLVVECTTMSKPCSSGRWHQGLAKVLSATAIRPCALRDARPPRRGRPACSSGLVGVSTQIIRVFGRDRRLDRGRRRSGRRS